METLTVVDCGSSPVALRRAALGDVPAIVSLLAADQLGATRDGVRSDQDLARRGALRAQIEAVRVHEDYRSHGLGAAMVSWAIAEARRRGCALVQLTTDKSRTSARRFYERLGFVASHEGMKLAL